MRTAASRVVTAVILLLGALVASDGGIAHAAAHRREAAHQAEHEVDRGAHHHDDGERQVAALEHHGDHAHARIDDGLRPRGDDLPLLYVAPHGFAATGELIEATGVAVPNAALSRADPATGPPPRLRAPPA